MLVEEKQIDFLVKHNVSVAVSFTDQILTFTIKLL